MISAAIIRSAGRAGWDLTNAVNDSISLDVVPQDTVARGFSIKSDGAKLYMLGDANDSIFQYSLPTPWSLTGGSYDSVSFSFAGQDTNALDMYLKPDDSKIYILGDANNTVFQYALATPGDLSTASYESKSFSVASQDVSPRGLFFKPDGTKMYIAGFVSKSIFQYSLSTPWDVSTASYDSKSFIVNSQMTFPQGLYIKPDGVKLYVLSSDDEEVFIYSMSETWDISTASYNSLKLSLLAVDNSVESFLFKPDGGRFYFLGIQTDRVHQYSVP